MLFEEIAMHSGRGTKRMQNPKMTLLTLFWPISTRLGLIMSYVPKSLMETSSVKGWGERISFTRWPTVALWRRRCLHQMQ